MAKARHSDYQQEIRDQIAAWDAKPGLRAVYQHWYQRIVSQLAGSGPTVEVGAGCGNFKRFYPQAIATDLFPNGSWIDICADARELPFANGSLGNVVLIDCLHHLPRPIDFLLHAGAKLRPGGRIILLEPAATPWARLVWRVCHHEPVDVGVDFVAERYQEPPDNSGFTYANMGTAQVLFVRQRAAVAECLSDLVIKSVDWSDWIVYPLTGGFSYLSLAPSRWIEPLHRWEEASVPRIIRRWLALRMLVVLERPSVPR
jgi:SAM-dependent methyltransferase